MRESASRLLAGSALSAMADVSSRRTVLCSGRGEADENLLRNAGARGPRHSPASTCMECGREEERFRKAATLSGDR
jgi:hypothetical protein